MPLSLTASSRFRPNLRGCGTKLGAEQDIRGVVQSNYVLASYFAIRRELPPVRMMYIEDVADAKL